MSWLTQRDPQTIGNYRYVEFEGGRVLQARELNDLQDSEALARQSALAAFFRDGAVLNLFAEIQGNGVHLTKRVALENLSIILNSACEPLPETTLALPAAKVNATDVLYAHWVLWRVTADGLHNGTPGCLVDASLIDAATNQKVSERGQLQLVLSFDATLSNEALDPVRMLAKSTSPIPVLKIVWTNSTPAVAYYDIFRSALAGSTTQPGVVKLSTDTSSTAVADDDPRLSAGSALVRTSGVSLPEETGGTTDIQSPEVKTGANDGGLDSARVWYGPLKAKVSDVLAYMAAKLVAMAATLAEHSSRLTALEARPGVTSSLDNHIGRALGRAADGSFTHKPVVTDPTGGYEHIGLQVPTNPGSIVPHAYIVRAQDGTVLGALSQSGEYMLLNPNMKNIIRGAYPTLDLCSYYTLALRVAYLSTTVEAMALRVL